MPVQFKAFWESGDAWADFRLNAKSSDADPDSTVLYSLKLHSLVLAAASPGHFKGHCEKQREDASHQCAAADRPHRSGSSRQLTGTKRRADEMDTTALEGGPIQLHIHVQSAVPGFDYVLSLHPREPEGVPRAVLCHLYTGALPDDPEELIWMLWRADYLDFADTLHAVLQKLVSLGSEHLTLQHAKLLSALPPLQCDVQPAAAASQPPAAVSAQLQELIDSLLLAHLPSAPAIVTDTALLAQFTQLPFEFVARWVELDEYALDSGNTVVVLFKAWHDAQPEPPSEEQCERLSALLPLPAVSFCFHQRVLERQRWWHRSFGTGKIASLTARYLATKARPTPGWTREWTGAAGTSTAVQRQGQTVKHAWQLPAADLRRLWQDKVLQLPSFYHAGYMLGVYLKLTHDAGDTDKSGPLFIGFFVSASLPDILLKGADADSQTALGVGDAIVSELSLDAPHICGVVTKNCDLWWHIGGWPKMHPALNVTTLKKLVPTAAAMIKIECTASLKA